MDSARDQLEGFAVRSRALVTAEGETIHGTVFVRGGLIQRVQEEAEQTPPEWASCPLIDLGDTALLPGFIDAHVHLNDPRPGEPWEGFYSGTMAALAGGITTLLDMPLNSLPVTTSRHAFDQKCDAASEQLAVDVGLYGGLVAGGASTLPELIGAGVWGVKCFLCDSGLDAFPATDHTTLREAMAWLGKQANPPPLLTHAERTDGPASISTPDHNPRDHRNWLASRPGRFEQAAVKELIQLVEETGCPLHVVHVADAGTADLIRLAKRAGLPITAETCPHYLMFCADDVPEGGTAFKCAPPIREPEHREALWQALADGTLDFVASDHSPCPPGMKSLEAGDFFKAWGGIASLELGPAITWTLAKQRGHTLPNLVEWWSHASAKRFGLPVGIAAGMPATFIAFDPDRSWQVDPPRLHQRHKITPYAGIELTGQTSAVWVRGQKVFDAGQCTGKTVGRIITRHTASEGN
ncbi:MAG: allantoinase AllB [Planctomycetota bacterium]